LRIDSFFHVFGDLSKPLRGRIGGAKFLLKLKADHIGEQSAAVGIFGLFGAKKGRKDQSEPEKARAF
jgi:hypothetical protein